MPGANGDGDLQRHRNLKTVKARLEEEFPHFDVAYHVGDDGAATFGLSYANSVNYMITATFSVHWILTADELREMSDSQEKLDGKIDTITKVIERTFADCQPIT